MNRDLTVRSQAERGRSEAFFTHWVRLAFEACQGISWQQLTTVAVLSLAWAMASLFAHVLYINPEWTRWAIGWSTYVVHIVLTGLMLFLAVRVVEQGQERPSVTHYLSAAMIALVLSIGIDFVWFYLFAMEPAGFFGNTPWEEALHRVIAKSGILVLEGGCAVLIYARLRQARLAQTAFAAAELERATMARHVLASRLSAMQAQVEPRFLFNALAQVDALYDRDLTAGDRMLDELIVYLRAALPRLRGGGSTLRQEMELTRAYLAIIQMRMGSRLAFEFDVPQALQAAHFPPMVLLPLIDNATRHGLEPCPLGGHIQVRAEQSINNLRISVIDSGAGRAETLIEKRGLATLRERLRGLYADQARLTLASNHPQGIIATVEIPHENPGCTSLSS
jgi:sensor histidine kinase YesM